MLPTPKSHPGKSSVPTFIDLLTPMYIKERGKERDHPVHSVLPLDFTQQSPGSMTATSLLLALANLLLVSIPSGLSHLDQAPSWFWVVTAWAFFVPYLWQGTSNNHSHHWTFSTSHFTSSVISFPDNHPVSLKFYRRDVERLLVIILGDWAKLIKVIWEIYVRLLLK